MLRGDGCGHRVVENDGETPGVDVELDALASVPSKSQHGDVDRCSRRQAQIAVPFDIQQPTPVIGIHDVHIAAAKVDELDWTILDNLGCKCHCAAFRIDAGGCDFVWRNAASWAAFATIAHRCFSSRADVLLNHDVALRAMHNTKDLTFDVAGTILIAGRTPDVRSIGHVAADLERRAKVVVQAQLSVTNVIRR